MREFHKHLRLLVMALASISSACMKTDYHVVLDMSTPILPLTANALSRDDLQKLFVDDPNRRPSLYRLNERLIVLGEDSSSDEVCSLRSSVVLEDSDRSNQRRRYEVTSQVDFSTAMTLAGALGLRVDYDRSVTYRISGRDPEYAIRHVVDPKELLRIHRARNKSDRRVFVVFTKYIAAPSVLDLHHESSWHIGPLNVEFLHAFVSFVAGETLKDDSEHGGEFVLRRFASIDRVAALRDSKVPGMFRLPEQGEVSPPVYTGNESEPVEPEDLCVEFVETAPDGTTRTLRYLLTTQYMEHLKSEGVHFANK